MKSMKEIREIVNASNARFWRLGDVWDDLTDAEQDRLVALAEGMAKDDTPLVRDPPMTTDEIATLNAARTILENFEAPGGYMSRTAGAAQIAADGIFKFLNWHNAYDHAGLTEAQLHNHDAPLVRDPESWQAVAAEGAKYR